MKYNELSIAPHDTSKRLGRGIASGKGKTAGRGTKGQGARQGARKRPGFEGGQNPLMQRLPKLPGATRMSYRTKAVAVYTGQLDGITASIIDTASLSEHGLIENPFVNVKLLAGKGKLSNKHTVKLQGASASAVALIQEAGGTFQAVPRAQRPATAKPEAEAAKPKTATPKSK